jgi:hypothetical protein
MAYVDEYLVGVGHAYYYDTLGNLILEAKTQIENSFTSSTANTEIHGGQNDETLFVYYHTAKLAVALKDAQFNLAFLAANFGSSITTGVNVWQTSSVTLASGGVGTAPSAPLQSPDSSAIYGWVTDPSGNTTKVTFTGSTFTLAGGTTGEVVTLRYFTANSAAQQIVIPAGIIPAIGRLVVDATLASSTTGTGILGTVQVEVPRFQMDGSNTIDLKSSGVYENDIKGMALKFTDASVGNIDVYAKVTQIINNANWYDNVSMIQNSGGDAVVLTSGNSTSQLNIYAIPTVGQAFIANSANLSYISSTPATCTVSATGLITRVTTGSSVISVSIVGDTNVACSINVTCS